MTSFGHRVAVGRYAARSAKAIFFASVTRVQVVGELWPIA